MGSPPFFGEALYDRAGDWEFIETNGAFPDVHLGLDVNRRNGGLDFEGMYWGCFEGGADQPKRSALDSF